jgi:hypothetical protein
MAMHRFYRVVTAGITKQFRDFFFDQFLIGVRLGRDRLCVLSAHTSILR